MNWLMDQVTHSQRSFCGLGCYETNVPMKTFTGQQNPLPAGLVIEALARMQNGKSTAGQTYAMGKNIMEEPTSCNAEFATCLREDSDWTKIQNIDPQVLENCSAKAFQCFSNSEM